MNNTGIMVIGGNSIEELEKGLEALKQLAGYNSCLREETHPDNYKEDYEETEDYEDEEEDYEDEDSSAEDIKDLLMKILDRLS